MKGDFLYWSLARSLDLLVWRGTILNSSDLPSKAPVVFVANHAAALGPIAVTASLPQRVFPWAISDMMDWDKAVDYLRKDFVEPQLHVPASASRWVSRLISQFSVRLLRGVDCIPVWQGDALRETYRMSVEYLVNKRSLLIFPEDPAGPMDDRFKMTPFKKGFARLGEMYFERTGQILQFCPLAIHLEARAIKVGEPVFFNPDTDPVHEPMFIKHALESSIHEMYLLIEVENRSAIPLPH